MNSTRGLRNRAPLKDWTAQAEFELTECGITLCELSRDRDRVVWPHATAGFGKVKKKIRRILDQLGLD
ncbi:hypothetical protein [Thioclava pacifica]|uniref:Uncharacterized protein n=1 Tax=Thioclava pacifica DSM 10166 TaxID=1353537 RepID=A0A074JGA3_9RHOB|nr:hypothetical protein [Thioclava pacifica]KEO54940.1 hypothetical protein TP2_16970 [Thioclava pacifica DSM 10166]